MKVLTERKDLLRPLLALVFSASLISGCNGKEPLPTASGADITASESENSIADITASESENSVAEAEPSETSASSVTTVYDPQAVLRYKELIAANEDEDNIPEDLVMKRVTEYDGDVQTNLYEDGRLIESSTDSSNIYVVEDIKYEYSGDDLIRIHETYGSKDRDGYPNEYDIEIERGEDQEKRICTHCRSGRLSFTTTKTYKDGLLYEETEEYDDVRTNRTWTYEYDGETLVRQTYLGSKHDYVSDEERQFGWIAEYSYDDKGRMIRLKEEYSDDYSSGDACIETWEYDDAGVLLHYEKTFEGRKSADEDYEDRDYEYIIDNGYTEISRGYVFDDDGNKTGKIRINTIEYDEHGREILQSWMIEGEEETRSTRMTENTYDDQGRIIKQESVWDNGDIFKVIEYEYKQ